MGLRLEFLSFDFKFSIFILISRPFLFDVFCDLIIIIISIIINIIGSNPPTRGKRAVNQPSSSNSPNNLDFSEEEEEGIENPDDLDEDFKNREQMIMIMAEAGVEALKPLGHQFKEFFLSCRYRGISCG